MVVDAAVVGIAIINYYVAVGDVVVSFINNDDFEIVASVDVSFVDAASVDVGVVDIASVFCSFGKHTSL